MDFFARFTNKAKEALSLAAECAKELGHNYVGTEHLLAGLCGTDDSTAKFLEENGITVENTVSTIIDLVGKGDYVINNAFGYTPRVKRILEMSAAMARQMGNNYVGTEHILFAMLCDDDSVAMRVVKELGGSSAELESGLMKMTCSNGNIGKSKGGSTPKLDKFGRDLTEAARNGELDPVIGRDSEIERMIQVLIRRTKNNPVLVGEPGVGKSAIAEGLASRIVEGNVPELLKDKRVVSLDLAGMIAGAKYRGEFEERFKDAINELVKDKNVILFIDELHTIVGAGSAEGSMDAANMLKPMLARGELQLIGATTLDEYRKYIEKDAALERRFAPITVGEPTCEETIQILKGLRDKYEAHHKVRITDEAIKAAVTLSDRYITDRFLPDKAIDLMDEAGSKVRIKMFSAPPDVKELEKRLEDIKKEKEQAVTRQEYEHAAELRDEEKKTTEEVEKIRKAWEEKRGEVKAEVTEKDIAEIVSDWTKVPVTQLTEDEAHKLLHLEEELHKRVIGQDEAVSAVAKAIRRARAGLKDPNRPIGSFIFLGPTGVGKTELSKALAEAMFGDEDAMIRLDMSEYMEKHTVSKLIGSPPGYVGFDDGGQLTEKVRRKPYCVLLFDEIEKAHPDVFNILLQILDDGRLTDAKGRTVDFKNCVIIMTSNIGATEIKQRSMGFGANKGDEKSRADYESMKESMITELKRNFRPEFINRIDDIIVFHKLVPEDISKITRLMISTVSKRLAEREIYLDFTDEAAELLSKQGFDEEYGARPLRRVIQQTVEDELSERILEGSIKFGDKVKMTAKDDKIEFIVEK